MTHSSPPGVSAPLQIVTLWGVFLLGTLFHTQLGLMPLFHGLTVAGDGQAATSLVAIEPILWMMLAFFMVPLVVMVATLFFNSRRYRTICFWTSAVYCILNLMHVVMDLFVRPIAWYQIALMVFLFLIGLLISLVSYQWMREDRPHRARFVNDLGHS